MARAPFAGQRLFAAVVEGWPVFNARDGVRDWPRLSWGVVCRTGLLRGLVALHLVTLAAIVPLSEPSLLLLAVTGTGLVVAALVLAGAGRVETAEVGSDDAPTCLSAAVSGPIETPSPSADPLAPAMAAPLGQGISRLAWAAPDPADLMARISHEIRTPLNAVIGFSDLMGTELFGPLGSDRYRDYVRHIRSSGHELLKSAEDTLALTSALANPPTGPMGAMDALPLAALVRDAFVFAAETGSPGTAQLECLVPEDIEVLGDRRALRQIFINLFEEAIARTGGAGTIAIAAESEDCLVQIEMSATTTNRSRLGSGSGPSLRLSVARALLEAYDSGLLVIEDEPGSWRTVTVLDRATQSDFFASGGSWVRPSPCEPQARQMPRAA